MRKHSLFLTVFIVISSISWAQAPHKPNSVAIYESLEKLNFLGSVLYFAAHPDDENTRLISYLSNHYNARTAYLSLTRGDGGQNLIGAEIREQLGVIRTQELLEARKIDGGQQFFTRANDFGYSKHPNETLAIWNKDEVVHDVVKVIREFQPDIIINRFDHRTPGRTHGHHTSSAMLSVETFDIAADPNFDADRIGHLKPWQTRRIFFNTSWWFYGSRENFDSADKTNMLSVDAGVYYPAKGLSNNEIAALSRSMHKSQGFGSTGTRGSQTEYLELVKGDLPLNKENLFDGINTTWSRLKGGAPIGQKIDQLLSNFNFNMPSQHIIKLLDIRQDIINLDDSHWKNVKLGEINQIIKASCGLYLEAKADTPVALKGNSVEIVVEAINRSQAFIKLESIQIKNDVYEVLDTLANNESKRFDYISRISEEEKFSNPYWLNEPGSLGMYSVSDDNLIGSPFNQSNLTVKINATIENQSFVFELPLIYKSNDPVDGEVYEPFVIMPKASIKFTDPVYIFPDREVKTIVCEIKSFADTLNGNLVISGPKAWNIQTKNTSVNLIGKGSVGQFEFEVKAPYLQESGILSVEIITSDGDKINQTISEIEYPHIPKQYVLSNAEAKIERINIKRQGDKIAYVMGAGDKIPESLNQIGYKVDILSVHDITIENLNNYDALIMGVRAYNTAPELNLKKTIINDYMLSGGTVIVQYNTNRGGVKGDVIAPYPMEISRDRVTDEYASVSMTIPDHEVLNYPNKISKRDFDQWVQERGLYFPNKWDERYQAPLACADNGEPLRKGGLLIADVGDGHFIYTGFSWFRQLPAGVPGAYRLFANLISIGKNNTSTTSSN